MQTMSGITFGVMVQPLASFTQVEINNGQTTIPEVSFEDKNLPFRCSRCKAYINPHFQFTSDGKKATCNLCLYVNDVPPAYYCALNEFGVRNDKEHRSELQYGAYTFTAPTIFTEKEPSRQRYVFLLDSSIFSIQSGFFHQVLNSLKYCIDSLPQDQNIEVCLITYDTSLTFYSVNANCEISLLHVGDIKDAFIPLPLSRLMLDVVKDRDRLNTVLDKVISMYSGQEQPTAQRAKYANQVCTGAALQACCNFLSQSGKCALNIFTVSRRRQNLSLFLFDQQLRRRCRSAAT